MKINKVQDSKIKKVLNPKIWNEDNSLKPEVKDKIDEVVQKFKEWLDESKIDIEIKDVIIIGSNASYNYNSKSDLDVHIIVPEADENILKLYDSYKTMFNKTYKIKFYRIPIELYVQNSIDDIKSKSLYSLEKGWLKEPNKEEMQKVDISSELQPLLDEYKQILENKDLDSIKSFINKLYDIRKDALYEDGDFAKGNLIFKEFRSKGYLKKLKDLQVKLESKELSLGDSKILDLPLKDFERIVNMPLWNTQDENMTNKNVRNILDFGWNFYKDYLQKGISDLWEEIKAINAFNRSGREFAKQDLGAANYKNKNHLEQLANGLQELAPYIRDELLNIKKEGRYSESFREYMGEIYKLIDGGRFMSKQKKDTKLKDEEVSEDEYERLVQKSSHPEILNFYDLSFECGEIVEKALKKLDLPIDGDWAITPEILKDNDTMDALYNEIRTQLVSLANDGLLNERFDTSRDRHYGTHETVDKIKSMFNLKAKFDSVKDEGSHVFKLAKRKNEYGEFVVKEYVDGKFREDGSYYTDDWEDAVGTMKNIASRLGLTVKPAGTGFIADSKPTVKDSGEYVYQFPADMTKEDITMAEKYGLKYLGVVNENGFQPGDHLIKGPLFKLKKYCREFLGYQMHPDYLYKENDIDLEDILDNYTRDSLGRKTYTIYSDKDDGPTMAEINGTLDQLGIGIKDVQEQSEDSYLVSFDATEEELKAIKESLNLPYEEDYDELLVGSIYYTGDNAYKITKVTDEEVEFIDKDEKTHTLSIQEFRDMVESDEFDTSGITREEAEGLGIDFDTWGK